MSILPLNSLHVFALHLVTLASHRDPVNSSVRAERSIPGRALGEVLEAPDVPSINSAVARSW